MILFWEARAMKAKFLASTVYFHDRHLGNPLEFIQLPDSSQFLGLIRADQLGNFQQNLVIQDGSCLTTVTMNLPNFPLWNMSSSSNKEWLISSHSLSCVWLILFVLNY